MDWTLEVMVVPVNDVDRPIPFYRDQLGFALDHDTRAGDQRADGRILSSRSTFWRPLLALSRQAWVWGKLNPDTAIPAGGGQPAGGAI